MRSGKRRRLVCVKWIAPEAIRRLSCGNDPRRPSIHAVPGLIVDIATEYRVNDFFGALAARGGAKSLLRDRKTGRLIERCGKMLF